MLLTNPSTLVDINFFDYLVVLDIRVFLSGLKKIPGLIGCGSLVVLPASRERSPEQQVSSLTFVQIFQTFCSLSVALLTLNKR